MPHESISVFDMLKIGVGPSSSHTLGPWRAAQRFTASIDHQFGITTLKSIKILLYGSLAKTGKGHGTDIAIQLGLAGEDPVTFDPATDIIFLYSETLPYHPNAMTFLAEWQDGRQLAETWYSIGGGFVKK